MVVTLFYKNTFRIILSLILLNELSYAQPITRTVTKITDSNIFSPATGELRWAINEINGNSAGGTIIFNIPASVSTSPPPYTINLNGTLPTINKLIIMDGSTQPAYSYTGVEPKINISGANLNYVYDGALCLNSGSSGSTIKNICIHSFIGDGIIVRSGRCLISNNVLHSFRVDAVMNARGIIRVTGDNNTIKGNIIGTNRGYSTSLPGSATTAGIYVLGGKGYNTIGGSAAGEANVVTNTTPSGFSAGFGVIIINSQYNKISRNLLYFSITNPGIRLVNINSNFLYTKPVITGFSSGVVTGTASHAGDIIEIFGAQTPYQSNQYITTATAGNTAPYSWSAVVNIPAWPYLTATATEHVYQPNTSEFSVAYTLPAPPTPCSVVKTNQNPSIQLLQPLNFATTDPAASSLQYKFNSLPVLNPPYTLRIEAAPEKIDIATGALVPDWPNAAYLTISNPTLATATTYSQAISSLTSGTPIVPSTVSKNYFWRVGIQYQPFTNGHQPVLWSTVYKFVVQPAVVSIASAAYLTNASQHTNKINWVFGVSYLDNGLTSEGIAYIDGLGKSRQVQSLMNSTNTVMAVEAAYSEEGGGVAMSLPAPISNPTMPGRFGYSYNFFDVLDGSLWSDFSTKHFDREVKGAPGAANTLMPPKAVDESEGVGKYYSMNNTDDYVDAAMGYPYAYNVPYNSPLQRPMLSAAGVGVDFKMTSGKEFRHFYGNPTQVELDRVYGVNKAPNSEKISRSITYNPDGVGSVSYTDNEGKLIATALTVCDAQPLSLKPLEENGMTGFTVHIDPLKTDVMDPTSLIRTASSKFFVPCAGTEVAINYGINLNSFQLNENTPCMNCKYDVVVKIVNEATGAAVELTDFNLANNYTKALIPAASTCVDNPEQVTVINQTVSLDGPATYTINRIIRPYTDTATHENVLTTAVNSYLDYLQSNQTALLAQFTTQYYTQTDYYVLRKQKTIVPSSSLTHFCSTTTKTFTGSTSGSDKGKLSTAKYNNPTAVTKNSAKGGLFYIADQGNHTIRKIDQYGNVHVLAGAATTSGFTDGAATVARFNSPYDVVFRPYFGKGSDQYPASIVVADKNNNAIRMVNIVNGATTTLSLTGISAPEGLGIDLNGIIYIASTGNNKIYSLNLSSGSPVLTQLASSYTFNEPTDIAPLYTAAGISMYVTDRGSNSLLEINTAGTVSTISNTFTSPVSVAVANASRIFISDQGNNKISTYNSITNSIQVLVGTGSAGMVDGTDNSLSVVKFDAPVGLFAESSSLIYVADKSNHRVRKVQIGDCRGNAGEGAEWYADQTNVTDITGGGYTKQLNQLDGDMNLDLQPGDEHYKLTSLAFSSSQTIPAIGTPPTSGSILANFINGYNRVTWVDLTDHITAMDVYAVGSGSTLNSSTISTIDEDNALNTSNQQQYYVLKVTFTKPSCAEACAGVNNQLACNDQCHQQLLALKADMDDAFDQLATSTYLYSGASLQSYVAANFHLNNNQQSQLQQADLLLYLNYENKRDAYGLFDVGACEDQCNGVSLSPCDACANVYESCVYEHQTDLNSGYDFIISKWDDAVNNPSHVFPFVYADLIHTSGTTTYPDAALSDALGLDLLNYIATAIQNPVPVTTAYTNFIDRSLWNLTGGACANCQAAATTSPACAAATVRDLSSFPGVLIPLLNDLSADCEGQYNNCLQLNGTTAQQNAFSCQQNKDQMLAALGPEPALPHNSTNTAWTSWNSSVTSCNTDYTNCINNVAPTTIDQVKSDMITQTLAALYPDPAQAGTVATLLAELITETASLTVPQLEQFLVEYEDEQQCIINCQHELTSAFEQWIHDLQLQASNNVNQAFIDGCYGQMNETFDISFTESMYHYTLYNYDFANNLVSTVPPEGIDYIDVNDPLQYHTTVRWSRAAEHRMLSTYKSTSLYTITASSPDEGSTRYLYDKAGRLRFSQTTEQKDRGTALGYKIFSYIKYDNEYRVIESGEYRDLSHQVNYWSQEDCPCSLAIFTFSAESQVNTAGWPTIPANTFEETYVVYDVPTITFNSSCSKYPQTYLQGRVSKTYNRDATTNAISSVTHYSYDAHGRVKFVIQEAAAYGVGQNSYKTIDYTYQGLTSRVDQIVYQKCNLQERFSHKYTYDTDYRITKTEVSRDGGTSWLPAAEYDYYLHGPLKRTGLGNKIQDQDYVYNINGWLKAINNPLTASYTNDGNESTGTGNFSPDVFSEAINYYHGDYKRTGAGLNSSQLTVPQTGSEFIGKAPDLFSGNISSTVTSTAFNLTPMTSPPDNILAQGYQYDYLNRLRDVYAEIQPENFTAYASQGASSTNQYASHITYDANGNIETFVRNTKYDGTSSAMDDMTYRYFKTTSGFNPGKTNNRLQHVNDAVATTATADDIEDQEIYLHPYSSTDAASQNYRYDAKGRLIQDLKSNITNIEWTASDKVKKVTKADGTLISFTYNAQQQRLTKKVDPTGTNDDVTTLYSYDASGILMATYEYSYNTSAASYKYKILDEQMYGMGRVGMYNVNEIIVTSPSAATNEPAKQFFELTDHLGSVRAVVSGVKQVSGNATIVQLTDYHEFGQTMQSRNFVSQSYRFGYQGSEKDGEVSGGAYTTDFRGLDVRIGRWLSPDPITHPWQSPYCSMDNNPIGITDVMGLDGDPPTCGGSAPITTPDPYGGGDPDAGFGGSAAGAGGGSGSGGGLDFSGAGAFDFSGFGGGNTAGQAANSSFVVNTSSSASRGNNNSVRALRATSSAEFVSYSLNASVDKPTELPIYYVFESATPGIYLNTKEALMRNPDWDKLTYNGGGWVAEAKRVDAMRCSTIKTCNDALWSKDEYPPATTYEGGCGANITCVDVDEQLKQSIYNAGFFKSMQAGDKFVVVLVPKGEGEKVPQHIPAPAPVYKKYNRIPQQKPIDITVPVLIRAIKFFEGVGEFIEQRAFPIFIIPQLMPDQQQATPQG